MSSTSSILSHLFEGGLSLLYEQQQQHKQQENEQVEEDLFSSNLQLINNAHFAQDSSLYIPEPNLNASGAILPHDERLEFGTGSFTISLWVKTTCRGSWKRLVSKQGADGECHDYFCLALECGVPVLDICGERVYAEVSDAVNDGKWHHIVAMRDSSGAYMGASSWNNKCIYVDRNRSCLEASSHLLDVSNHAHLELGRWAGNSEPICDNNIDTHHFSGYLKMLRIIPMPLAKSQIDNLYKSEYYQIVKPIDLLETRLEYNILSNLLKEFERNQKTLIGKMQLDLINSLINSDGNDGVKQTLNKLDFDGDGLDIIQIIGHALKKAYHSENNEQTIQQIFNLLDLDGDGHMNHNEMKSAVRILLMFDGIELSIDTVDQLFDDSEIVLERISFKEFVQIPPVIKNVFMSNLYLYM
jgi:hypothetical protein